MSQAASDQKRTTFPQARRAHLRTMAMAEGVAPLAERIGVGRETLVRAIAGIAVRRGTFIQIEAFLVAEEKIVGKDMKSR